MVKFSLEIQHVVHASGLPNSILCDWIKKTFRSIQKRSKNSKKSLELCLRLVNKREMQILNRDFRNCDRPTNVLTFAYSEITSDLIRSDIILCIPFLKMEAEKQNKLFLHHAAHLVIHGTLHAFGFNHKNEAETRCMKNLETRVMLSLNMPDPN